MTDPVSINSWHVRAHAADSGPAGPELVAGQRLVGRVLAVLADGSALLGMGDRRIMTPPGLPLSPGQPVTIDVVAGGDSIELRVLPQTAPAAPAGAGPLRSDDGLRPDADVRAALALLSRAQTESQATGGSRAPAMVAGPVADAAADLVRSVAAVLPAQQAQALARLLLPLPVGADTAQLVAALRNVVEHGGLLFEARVRAALAAHPEAGPSLEAALQHDLKSLLKQLTRDTIVPPAAGENTAPGSSPMLGALVGPLADSLLARQLDFAFGWLADGTLRFEMPVSLPGGDSRARVRFRREGGSRAGDRPGSSSSATVRVETEAHGAIEATARWGGGGVRTEFVVDREATRDLLLRELPSPTLALESAFDRVAADVRVDPEYLRQPDPGLPPPSAGGALVNTHA